jgi:hypothetical protein
MSGTDNTRLACEDGNTQTDVMCKCGKREERSDGIVRNKYRAESRGEKNH